MHLSLSRPPLSQKDLVQEMVAPASIPFCQLQLRQLVRGAAALAGWLAYQDGPLKRPKVVSDYQQPPYLLDAELLESLESGRLVKGVAPDLGLQQIPLRKGMVAYVWLPPFSNKEGIQHVVLWCDRILTAAQIEQLENQIEVLSYSLVLEQQCQRQTVQINTLQQSLARIEHQLRNPLALIHLYTENLYRCLGREADKAQARLIRNTTRHLIDHLTEVVQASQQTDLKVCLCDLKIIFEESLQGFQLLIQEKQIQITYPTTSLSLAADQGQLKQVFDNLLHNALCFSPSGGTVTCSWQGFQEEVLITIADQGRGLSPIDLQRMFQPHYSSRPGGTGLGLPIAQKVVKEHHGNLWADNLARGGAQFSISLPRGVKRSHPEFDSPE